MLTCLTPSASHLACHADILLGITFFDDGAYDIKLPEDLANCVVRLIHNNRTHDDWILLYLLLGQLGRRNCQVELVLPYLSYGRQSSDYLDILLRPLLGLSFVQAITTVDLHQEYDGLVNLTTAALVAADIQERGLQEAVLIAPDHGASRRVEQLARLTGQRVVSLYKERSANSVSISSTASLSKEKEALIVDDMIDTGTTLQACIDHIFNQGVSSVHVIATHAVLSSGVGAWVDKLASLTFTNTLFPGKLPPSIRWLDIRKELSSHAT